MFILTTIESDIRVHPKDLNKPPLVAVTDVIEQQYLDKVIPDLGLPVTIYDVQNIGRLVTPRMATVLRVYKTIYCS
jgi:DNA-directed RNA polymerase III subunit RPC8